MCLLLRADAGGWFCLQLLRNARCLVRRLEQANFQSAKLDFWTGLDNSVFVDWIGRWNRLEQKCAFHFDEAVVDANGTQRDLEPSVLCVSNAQCGVDCHFVDVGHDHCIYEVKFQANTSCDLLVRSLFRLGCLRDDPQRVDRLAKSGMNS